MVPLYVSDVPEKHANTTSYWPGKKRKQKSFLGILVQKFGENQQKKKFSACFQEEKVLSMFSG